MNKEETLALWAQGKDAWNAWAQRMLDQRAEMEKAHGPGRPTSESMSDWIAKAAADFSAQEFGEDMNFDSFVFPGQANFNKTVFRKEARFGGGTFKQNAEFSQTIFSGDVWFHGRTFNGHARFEACRFGGYTSFREAVFLQHVNLTAAKVEGPFSLEEARFDEVPDFTQAHFAEAPRLDNVRVHRGKGDADLSARYRALKRLAIDAHDHAREQEYFAGELKALRGHPDRCWPNPLNWFRRDEGGRRKRAWPGGARYWFGLLYQVFSDFGRSIGLPLIWLAATAFISAWAYLGLHFARIAGDGRAYGLSSIEWIGCWIVSFVAASPPPLSCVHGSFGEPWSAARLLSLAKTLPYAGAVPAEKLTEVFSCLYGKSIPSCVVVIGIVQLLLSLLLLFLFLLAVRNHFRIR